MANQAKYTNPREQNNKKPPMNTYIEIFKTIREE